MISKITAILAAALVLGSAGAASAQTHRHAGWQAPYANSYNQDTRNLRYGQILLQKSAILVVGLPLRPLEAEL